MSVDVGHGIAAVAGATRTATPDAAGLYAQGIYIAKLTSGVNVSVAAAPTSSTRTDAVYLQIADKTETSSGNNEAIIKISRTTTTRCRSPSLLLGVIVVGTNVTSIVNANIFMNAQYAQHPLLNGYVDKASTDTTTSIAPKRVSK